MLKYLKNIFVIVFIVFAVWMLFIDSNSLLIHNELNNDISDLEDEKAYYRNEIEKDKKAIKELSTDEGVEKLAREKYYMKKDDEDIYIIEYEDSLKLEKTDE
ncbi:septum formation initiator family protein [Psychroserpens sp. SPM9]|uniref:FtsB family cell division protein n=1 Tax=Psychroserpens sp. SPM9 TaxID=2975598 RepID=UPI0021A4F0F0|nr:septum formation initiator family protein [Psychroserpens sp. SPM9]MDG5491528.1 septum formation initiator family protein [Psychroserpens sp. SPM9]